MSSAALHFVSSSPAHARAKARAGGAICFRGVTKSFDYKAVLRDIDLEIDAGEFVAIVGRSGCGKSTLLRLAAGIDAPTTGGVYLDSEPIEIFCRKTRMMFQEPRLLPWKRVIENVGLGLKGDWLDLARSALTEVGLQSRANDWPAILSGGQRQRVALARALATRPSVLLLDEPLGALDALTRIEMQGLIEEVWRNQGFTAVLVTHDVAEAVALADRVIMIEQGKIALDATIELPRPRTRGTPLFGVLESNILSRLLAAREE